ncbi:Replicative DNA helicase [Pseudoalteromonas sp. S3785]|uniref:tetratricopeptide repeat protein n=1 Tax=Pseudoalteromonas sp. S3785 TaxID=579545 RepID=UPI00110AC417|nr:tetratricopeptide repeat protein [Pseudoalteromonas sp. S3785]TMO73984.1 Replicative DNA helicase [Pseudoalteromonas sp. S3785]
MMNTKVYKAVHDLAEQLMEAANRNDRKRFELLFSRLKTICEENENTSKDHPVQWETLADFTEELEDALTTYEKALEKSIAINNKDHIASIAYSMATLQIELGKKDEAINSLKSAKVSANKIEDKELKAEIHELLESLIEED